MLYDENNENRDEDVDRRLNRSRKIYFQEENKTNIRTRNQDKSGRTRRNDVVNDPVPRLFRVVTTALIVAVS